jgi:RNA-directed DNA polymerase
LLLQTSELVAASDGEIPSGRETINHGKSLATRGDPARRLTSARQATLAVAGSQTSSRNGYIEHEGLFCKIVLGVVSPLLANVYLHELDKYMRRYTALSEAEKTARRRGGLANFVYTRYADDFVVLCNGTREQAEAMRQELHTFLASSLRLTLSLEKTKVTHLNDGFDFLGFHLRRCMGGSGVGVKTTISEKALQRHLDYLRAATAPTTHGDSVACKILALNRVIGGWCRYFQYTSKVAAQFSEMEHAAYWMLARWLAGKHRLSVAQALRRFAQGGSLGVAGTRLIRHTDFHARTYARRFFKPNPYTVRETLDREELLESSPWTGYEDRPGMADLRPLVLRRDGYRCRLCGEPVRAATCQVDHIRPVHHFKRPVDANYLENLWTLCIPCHLEKTERDRQRESRVQ